MVDSSEERKLGITCCVCGEAGLPWTAPDDITCSNCDAGFATMQLAAMLLSEADGGVAPTLTRLVTSGRLGDRIILDYTSDSVLAAALRPHAGYQSVAIFSPNAEPSGDDIVHKLRSAPADFADVLLFRDAVSVVPHLRRFLNELPWLCRSAGVIIIQDRFAWPLPEHCEEIGAGEARPIVQFGTDAKLPMARRLGADLLTQLRELGLVVYADRTGMAVDPLYRSMAIVAQKP